MTDHSVVENTSTILCRSILRNNRYVLGYLGIPVEQKILKAIGAGRISVEITSYHPGALIIILIKILPDPLRDYAGIASAIGSGVDVEIVRVINFYA